MSTQSHGLSPDLGHGRSRQSRYHQSDRKAFICEAIMQVTNRTSRVNDKEKKAPAVQAKNQRKIRVVTGEQRRHLAECCAFFKAARYREAGPGTIRESDVKNAEDEINRIIESCHTTRKRST
jgi:hypothetical protein